MIDSYCASPPPIVPTFEFKFHSLSGWVRSLTMSGDELVGDIFRRYVGEINPESGAQEVFAQPLVEWLPFLYTKLRDLPHPPFLEVYGVLNLGTCAEWMTNCAIVAAFEAKVQWPPWNDDELDFNRPGNIMTRFARDPFNGKSLGSDVNRMCNLIGMIAIPSFCLCRCTHTWRLDIRSRRTPGPFACCYCGHSTRGR